MQNRKKKIVAVVVAVLVVAAIAVPIYISSLKPEPPLRHRHHLMLASNPVPRLRQRTPAAAR